VEDGFKEADTHMSQIQRKFKEKEENKINYLRKKQEDAAVHTSRVKEVYD